MKHRSRIEVTAQILEAANGSYVTKTKIMYKALVNYNQLEEQLVDLTENGLLSYDKDTQTFKTTEKGLQFLQIYKQIDEMINAPE